MKKITNNKMKSSKYLTRHEHSSLFLFRYEEDNGIFTKGNLIDKIANIRLGTNTRAYFSSMIVMKRMTLKQTVM
jgi:hypothetical protein